ncbi:MAG: GAP family protein [Candidatus Geothermincolia bacterium]
MGKVIGDILPLAIGVGISPVPIIAVILMLGTPRGRVNGPMFLLGWLAGAAIAGGIVLVIADAVGVSTGDASTGTYVLKLVLGVLLLGGAFRQWRSRPKEGEEPKMPKWMTAIDNFTWAKSLGLGAGLSGINPKNLALIIAAGAAIAQSGISTGQQIGVLAVFVAIATVGVVIPLVVYFAMKERAVKILEGWKTWLASNNPAVMTVLFLVFGAMLIGKGIMGLT